MGRVEDKVVLITGGARGQGRSHAVKLAEEGADVILFDICHDIETNEYPLARPEDLDETARLVEKEGQRVFTEIADVRDRAALFREIRRVLIPGGRFSFTDAGVVTGLVSADEFRLRANRGFTLFVAPGLNERSLKEAGFEVLDVMDRTTGLIETAGGRLRARSRHESKLRDIEGDVGFEREQQFLRIVLELAQRRALSRMRYLAQTATA